jgi:hypothetical protein
MLGQELDPRIHTNSRDVAPRARHTGRNAKGNWVGRDPGDRNCRGCCLECQQQRDPGWNDHVRPHAHDLAGEFVKALLLTTTGISLHDQIFPFDIA